MRLFTQNHSQAKCNLCTLGQEAPTKLSGHEKGLVF